MHTSKRAESPRTRSKKILAEGLVRLSDIRGTSSPSESHQGESRQPGGDPLRLWGPSSLRTIVKAHLSQGRRKIQSNNHSTRTQGSTRSVCLSSGRFEYPNHRRGHTQDVIVRIPSGGDSFATSLRNPDPYRSDGDNGARSTTKTPSNFCNSEKKAICLWRAPSVPRCPLCGNRRACTQGLRKCTI